MFEFAKGLDGNAWCKGYMEAHSEGECATIKIVPMSGYYPSSSRAGDEIRLHIKRLIDSGSKQVVLDFFGVDLMTDSFLHSMIGVLAEEKGQEWIDRHLRVDNLDKSNSSEVERFAQIKEVTQQ